MLANNQLARISAVGSGTNMDIDNSTFVINQEAGIIPEAGAAGEARGHNTVERTQFPTRSGPAKTFNKAQGETAKAGHLDFQTFARPGAAYVTCCRLMSCSTFNIWQRQAPYLRAEE